VNTGNTLGASTATVTVSCPAGTKLLSGGANIVQTGNTKAAVSGSYPSGANAWTATSVVTVAGTGQPALTAYAVCTAP
jgi:hypothetical protein